MGRRDKTYALRLVVDGQNTSDVLPDDLTVGSENERAEEGAEEKGAVEWSQDLGNCLLQSFPSSAVEPRTVSDRERRSREEEEQTDI